MSHESKECFGVRSDLLCNYVSLLWSIRKLVGDAELGYDVQSLCSLVARHHLEELLFRRILRTHSLAFSLLGSIDQNRLSRSLFRSPTIFQGSGFSMMRVSKKKSVGKRAVLRWGIGCDDYFVVWVG